MRPTVRAAVLAALLAAGNAAGCDWDEDTLRDEQRGLPTVASMLAGKWERHSAFFYEDRVRKMEALLAKSPDDRAAMDNLGVALEKLGRFDEAIALMESKLALDPSAYTSLANLGTFYLHRGGEGDLDRGVACIRRALEVNPHAHFGRERYQLMAAEYVRDAKADPERFEQSFAAKLVISAADNMPAAVPGQAEATESGGATEPARGNPALNEAIEGVVGMIRFGPGISPHLFFALGDLLMARGDLHLAYRAYKRAIDLGHPRPDVLRFRMHWVSQQTERGWGFSHDLIAREQEEGARWVAAYQAYEDDLVRRGVSTADESVYRAFYRRYGGVRTMRISLRDRLQPWRKWDSAVIVVAATISVEALILLAWLRRRWSRHAKAGTGR